MPSTVRGTGATTAWHGSPSTGVRRACRLPVSSTPATATVSPVVQDVVYNHLGPSGNYLPEFGPYLHHDRGNTWGDALALDELEVRRFILDNAAMWFRDMHVDALRLDAVHALVDDGPVHLLAELAERTAALGAALGRPLTLIAESDLNDPTMITPVSEGGLGMDAQWSDDFHHAVHVRLTGETSGY